MPLTYSLSNAVALAHTTLYSVVLDDAAAQHLLARLRDYLVALANAQKRADLTFAKLVTSLP